MNQELKAKLPMIIAIIVVVIVAVAIFYYYVLSRRPVAPPPVLPVAETQPPAGASIAKPDLGSTLYEDAKNPISKKLPASAAPVSNPIQGIYKNPFE